MLSNKFRVLLLLIALTSQYGTGHAAPGEKESVEVNEIADSDYQPPSRIQKTTVSKSGRMMLEFGPADSYPTWVAVRSTTKGAESEHIFSQKDGLHVEAEISDDDRLIVVSSGGASMGVRLDVFERMKNGKYKQHTHPKEDISDRAWAMMLKARKLSPSGFAGHSYSNYVKLYTDPLSVVFRLDGDYSGGDIGRTTFGPVYFRYTIQSKKLEIIPRPLDLEPGK